MTENIWSKFISIRRIDGKNKRVVVNICRDIINRDPTREELKGLRPELSKKELSKNEEYLLEFIRYFNNEEGRPPEERDFRNNPRYLSCTIYQNFFGNWNNAIEKAGFVRRKHKIYVSFDEQNYFWVIVDNAKFIRHPTEDDLKGAIEKSYNHTNICQVCRKKQELTDKSILYPGNARRETDKSGKKIEKWNCERHGTISRQRYDPNSHHNIIKSLGDRRTGNQDPNSSNAKGDRGEDLLCAWKGYTNLNKKNDNYSKGTRIDCLDEKTGEYYQTKIAYYNSRNNLWGFDFRKLQESIIQGFRFKSIFLFCISEDGQIVNRIYEIPEKEIYDVETRKGKASISVRNNAKGWYELYRIINDEELNKINKMW